MTRHTELCDRVADLAGKAFVRTHMHDNPFIYAGCAAQRQKVKTSGTTPSPSKKKPEATEYKGDLLIHDLWKNGASNVHNMRVVNTDAKYHLAKTPENCLQEVERETKKMYLEVCLQ